MEFLRLSTAILLMLGGGVGLLICLIGIYAARRASASAAALVGRLLDSTQEGSAFLRQGTSKIETRLAETEARTRALEATLADIADRVEKSGKISLSALDEHISTQFQRAQTAFTHLQSTLDGFQNTLVLFRSISILSRAEPLLERQDAAAGEDLSRSLADASEISEQVARFLNEFLTDREVTHKSLSGLMASVKQIQTRLSAAESRVDAFQQRLSLTVEKISSSRQQILYWIGWGGIIAVVILASFAFTHLGLLLQAWSLMRTSPS